MCGKHSLLGKSVQYIDMSPEISASLDYASKLNRSPSFIQNLIADGEKQTEAFLQNLMLAV
jgi:NTE family protein